jgi:hypothetical protein
MVTAATTENKMTTVTPVVLSNMNTDCQDAQNTEQLFAIQYRLQLCAIQYGLQLHAIQYRLQLQAIQYGLQLFAIQYGLQLHAIQYGLQLRAIQYGLQLFAIQYRLQMHAIQYELQLHAMQYGLQNHGGLQLCNFSVHTALVVHLFTLNSLVNRNRFLIYALSVLVEHPLASYALFC